MNKKAQAGMKIIMMAIMVIIVVVIFVYGYKYTVGLKDKLKGEGLIGGKQITGNWSAFEMPHPSAEPVDCFIGVKDGVDLMKKYPVRMCPVDLDDIGEDRIVYEGFLVANRKYGLGYSVKNVYVQDCPQCYTISLSNGTNTALVKLNGLIEEEVKIRSS